VQAQLEEGYDWTTVRLQDPESPAANLKQITGTLKWAPLSVLDLMAHKVSSQLEGLFLSVLSISCDGKLPSDDFVASSVAVWKDFRQGAMVNPTLRESSRIASHLGGLVGKLHNLFYPPPLPPGAQPSQGIGTVQMRSYRVDVAAREVQDICMAECNNSLETTWPPVG
jgi:hypothetical protein